MALAFGTPLRAAACDARLPAACDTIALRSTSTARSRRRPAAVVASAGAPQAPPPPPPTPRPRGARRQLLRSLAQQTVEEAWGGWLGDLVLPLLTDDPGSSLPPRAVPPQQLADPDSSFVEVEGVALHYKAAHPCGSSSDSAGGSALASGRQAAPARPTVLLVHGLNGSTFNWRATMQPLADATGCRYGAWGWPRPFLRPAQCCLPRMLRPKPRALPAVKLAPWPVVTGLTCPTPHFNAAGCWLSTGRRTGWRSGR